MKLEKTITIMGGIHTLPRCQAERRARSGGGQCTQAAQSGKQFCSAHKAHKPLISAYIGVDIDAVHRKQAWAQIVEQAQKNVGKWLNSVGYVRGR